MAVWLMVEIAVADLGGGLTHTHTPLRGFFVVACQYMKIPVDLDPNPPPP